MLLSSWEFAESGSNEWRDAVVPGHVHLDLIRYGLIEDPFLGTNERDCQWVDEKDWTYRCLFTWKPSDGGELLFEGLDTVATIRLNGKVVGEHDNMFTPLKLDISEHLREGENELDVEFQSAARIGRERKEHYFREQNLPAGTPNFDERAFVRKAQCMFGWDWGPRLVSCGIWRPVHFGRSSEKSEQAKPDRRIELVETPVGDGATFEFRVDGQPFYALGANWIPDYSFPSHIPAESYRERLQQAKDLGINMLRVWGGGIYEHDAFYDICDELGILVWQDFMFACSYYPDTSKWQEAIRGEAEYQICRLRHHPCIAIWCGNNECHQVWQDGWGGKDKQPSRFHGEILYHQILKDAVERLDPDRPYWPGSPFGSGYCNSGKDGDQHFWDVWHGRGDWTYYKESDARFCSEFGFASSPSKATWASVGVDSGLAKEDELARWHNKTGKPFETITGLVQLHYPEAKSLDEWSYYSQLNQRDAMRAALEHFRFSGRCRGALLWQLNDIWPVESWSVFEYGGRMKAAAFELKRLFSPLLLRITADEERVKLMGCLHNLDARFIEDAALEAFDLRTGDPIDSQDWQVSLQRDERKLFGELPVISDRDVVWKGKFCGASVLSWTAKPVGWRDINVKVRPSEHGFLLSAEEPIFDAYLEDTENPEAIFEPNFFSLLPGESVPVRVSDPVGNLRVRCLDFGR